MFWSAISKVMQAEQGGSLLQFQYLGVGTEARWLLWIWEQLSLTFYPWNTSILSSCLDSGPDPGVSNALEHGGRNKNLEEGVPVSGGRVKESSGGSVL